MAVCSLTCSNPNHDSGIKHDLLIETDGAGDQCMICLSNISESKLAHKTCSFQACKSCLLQWLAENFSCPLCRRELRFKCPCLMTDEEEAENEIEHILTARAARPPPTSYRVVIHLAAIHTILSSAERSDPRQSELIWTHINNDVEDSMLLLESEDLGEDGLIAIKTQDLIRRLDEFQFDRMSIQQLWIASRVMGVRWFYLTRIPVQPEIAFWTPLIPDFHLFGSGLELPMRVQAKLDAVSTTLQIPIPTRIFADIVRATRRLYPWESQAEIRRLYALAQTDGINHFRLVDIRGELNDNPTWDVRDFYALPWPHQAPEAYSSKQLSGCTSRDISARLGWDSVFDQEMITSVTSLFQAQNDLDYDAHAFEYYGMPPTETHQNPLTYDGLEGRLSQQEVAMLDYD